MSTHAAMERDSAQTCKFGYCLYGRTLAAILGCQLSPHHRRDARPLPST